MLRKITTIMSMVQNFGKFNGKKLSDILISCLRELKGIFEYKLGIDYSKAIQMHAHLSKKYNVPEQANGYVERYNELKDVLDKLRSFVISLVRKKCGENPNCKILDYGCGTGRYLELLCEYNIYGIDANCHVLEKFTKKSVPEAKLFCLDFTNNSKEVVDFIHKNQSSFDVIYSIQVIQLLRRSKIDTWFDNISKLMKPSGIFIIHFPTPCNISDRNRPGYVRYMPKEIVKMLEMRGFKIIFSESHIFKQIFNSYRPHKEDFGYFVVAEKVK